MFLQEIIPEPTGCDDTPKERSIIEELRPMGNEVLHSWARRQEQKKEEECNKKPGVNRREKTLCWYTRFGKIEIVEQIFTQGRRGSVILRRLARELSSRGPA